MAPPAWQVHTASPHGKAGDFLQAFSVTPTISSLGERALIRRLRSRLRADPDFVRIGIGDDAAVFAPARSALEVVTTDSLVEGVHFRREWTVPEAIGHKALAVNLSDLAAMGATPRAALLSLILPPDFPVADFDALLDGFVTLADRTKTALIGGNLTRSPGPLVIDVTAIGAVRRRGILTRGGGTAGQDLYVTGTLGAAATGHAMLVAGVDREPLDEARRACLTQLERPEPRLRCGSIVGRTGAASAAMDLSDGLADAVRQIAEASGTGAVLEAAAIPIAEGARAWAEAHPHAGTAFDRALTGGEDYELLFAVPPRRRSRLLNAGRRCGLTMTRVGQLVAAPGLWLDSDGIKTILPEGYAHFG